MFKSFAIFLLTVALSAAAFVTRPSEQSARAFLTVGVQPDASSPKTLPVAVKDAIIKSAEDQKLALPAGYEFKDRVLWVEVKKDGQTVFTGLLSHWIKHEPPAPATPGTPAAAPATAGR